MIAYRLRFVIQKESRSALFLYACFEAGIAALAHCPVQEWNIAFSIRTFFDTHDRLLSLILFLQTKHYEIERSDPHAFF